MKLSPQKTIIVETLRDLNWHCGREWVDRIKDDRIRITELNRGYMLEKGYEIVGEPCRGEVCGRKDCPLYKRRAQLIGTQTPPHTPPKKEEIIIPGTGSLRSYEELQKAGIVD